MAKAGRRARARAARAIRASFNRGFAQGIASAPREILETMPQNHTNDGLPLPDACAHRVLSFLPAKQILSTAAASRGFANVAKAPELWLEACKSKWPDVRTSAVVARAARTRGPMAFYRRRVSCSRELSVPTLPLCDLDDLVFTVDIEQGATQLCSVAIEARDAMRRDLPADVENHRKTTATTAKRIPWTSTFGRLDGA